jgi:acyl-CoA thioesterase-1
MFWNRAVCPFVVAMIAAGCDGEVSATAPSSAVAEIRRIAVLGDSLAISPSRAEGFPAILQSRMEARRMPWTVTNFGVRGDTTTGALRRLNEVLGGDPAIVIVALGANDGIRGVPTATVTRNLSEIIERAQTRGARVLLCGMETPPINGWNYTVAFHHVFPDLAAKYNVPLVPFLLATVALNPEMNGDDLIHPNAAGARQIADTIWPYLEPMITPITSGLRR